jgi:putative salt-induced outer membrane protein YdiY
MPGGIFERRRGLVLAGLFAVTGLGPSLSTVGTGLGVPLVPAATASTIVNTLRGFDRHEPGWSGALEAGFSQAGGNTKVLSLSGAARVQWLRGRQRWRTLGGVRYAETAGEKIAEEVVGHLRHNYEILPWLDSLAFAQLQRNPFQRLRSRLLLGVGARFDLLDTDTRYVALGLSTMHEVTRLDGENGEQVKERLSSFLNVNSDLVSDVTLDVTGFLQPRWVEFSDLRAVLTATLTVPVGDAFSFLVTYRLQYDSRPPEGVEDTDWWVDTGVSYEF